MDRRDKGILIAILVFSLDTEEEHILHSKFKESERGKKALEVYGDRLDMHIRMLAADGYLEDLQEEAGQIIGYSVSIAGFEECAVQLRFNIFDKMLYSAIRRIVTHGIPMTGNDLLASLESSNLKFGPLSPSTIFYILKAMRSRWWIDFSGFIGGELTITSIKPEGHRAADPTR